LRKAIEINVQIKNLNEAARTLHNLGSFFFDQGLLVKSAEVLNQAIDLYRDAESREEEADCLYKHALALERQGRSVGDISHLTFQYPSTTFVGVLSLILSLPFLALELLTIQYDTYDLS
jgi:tetratricopeptide (TPR) repeat protein